MMKIISARIFYGLCSLLFLLNTKPSSGENTEQPAVELPRDGQHDFDFFVGSWKVHNRRLRNPLTGSNTWVEFEGTSVNKKIWGGRANFDEDELDDPSGHVRGMTLRLYDPQTHLWSRFLWLYIKPNSCRWEQAFSADGGKTWETNWIMDFQRTDAPQA